MLSALLALNACGFSGGSSMLHVAPQTFEGLPFAYLDAPPPPTNQDLTGPIGEKKSDAFDSLTYFLDSLNINYQIIPGDYLLFKLEPPVRFRTGSYKVSMDDEKWLSQLGLYLSVYNGVDVVLDGHTDIEGSDAFNDVLALNRSNALKAILTQQNVSNKNIFTRGYSDEIPRCTNSTVKGKACNRRVEVTLILPN